MNRPVAGLLVVALLTAPPAYALGPGFGYVTGKALLEACDKDTPVSTLFCESYIMGAVDAAVNLDRVQFKTAPHFCIPTGVFAPEMVRVVKAYLHNNPDDIGDVAGEMVDVAVMRAFPCAGK